MRPFVVLVALPVWAAAWSGVARATPEYPSVIDGVMDTDCASPSRCLICHTSSAGGQTTATQPFAMALRSYGLVRGRDPAGLTQALTLLPEGTDSDADGMPDKRELDECFNPSGGDSIIEPVYGCGGATLAAVPTPDQASPSAWPVLVALAWMAGLVRSARYRPRLSRI